MSQVILPCDTKRSEEKKTVLLDSDTQSDTRERKENSQEYHS